MVIWRSLIQTIYAKGRVYNYSNTIGRNASSGPGFRHPVDMVLGDDDRTLYVVNRGDEFQTCQRITMLSTDETFLGEFGSYGTGPGQFVWPSAIAIDSNKQIYIADQWTGRITVFNPDGDYLKHWGIKGEEPGQLLGPTGLAFDKNNSLYITDYISNRVQNFSAEGEYIRSLGETSGNAGFSRPWGLHIDLSENIFIADWNNHRIQKFGPDGTLMLTIEGESTKEDFRYPSHVTVDSDDDIYISDWWNNKVLVFDKNGHHITTFIGNAEELSGWAQQQMDASPDHTKGRLLVQDVSEEWRFNRPTAIVIDKSNRIFIAESQRMRIQIYKKESKWEDPQFNL
ncbi:uncharacterized protein METZ01_LOCUS110083 [marine metagenome]|uniref:SMP-30/Gluconolactonase/LRE-like region domain-containing protein n=1 Tax=marine metagenome TaxID=408172 RepID=A0A381WXG8_9ZZZZ